MAKLFDELLEKGLLAGQIPGKTSTARKWFREQAKAIGKVNETILFKTSNRTDFRNNITIGRLYMFYYDAKHKETLPYYDRVPLIFPIGPAKGGFLGINMHYLPLRQRAKLMDALYSTINNDKLNETTKIRASYEILASASKFAEFKPTIKHYLKSQVRSRYMYIDPKEWDIAIFLNVAKFVGATQRDVWSDSLKIIQGDKTK